MAGVDYVGWQIRLDKKLILSHKKLIAAKAKLKEINEELKLLHDEQLQIWNEQRMPLLHMMEGELPLFPAAIEVTAEKKEKKPKKRNRKAAGG